MTTKRSFKQTVAASLATLALGSASAEAIDVRSWDQKIPNAGQRFVVLAAFDDEAVLDKETQLVWQRTPSSGGIWVHSVRTCANATTGGRRGWRLPTVDELSSLLMPEPNQLSGILPFGHPFLGLSTSDGYWTSTRVPGKAFKVGLTTGLDGQYVYEDTPDTNTPGRGWCVRGGGQAIGS